MSDAEFRGVPLKKWFWRGKRSELGAQERIGLL